MIVKPNLAEPRPLNLTSVGNLSGSGILYKISPVMYEACLNTNPLLSGKVWQNEGFPQTIDYDVPVFEQFKLHNVNDSNCHVPRPEIILRCLYQVHRSISYSYMDYIETFGTIYKTPR